MKYEIIHHQLKCTVCK